VRPLPTAERRLLVAGLTVGGVTLAVLSVNRALLGWPGGLGLCLALAAVPIPVAAALCATRRCRGWADEILVHTVGTSGAIVVAATIFLVIVVGLGRVPDERERSLLLLAMAGAGAGTLAFEPTRRAFTSRARKRLTGDDDGSDAVLKVFGQRIRRDIPMEEVLLQSAEALRRSMSLDTSEIWTGRDGRLERTASVPERPTRALALDAETAHVAARAGVVGPAWLRVWLPELVEGPSGPARRNGHAPSGPSAGGDRSPNGLAEPGDQEPNGPKQRGGEGPNGPEEREPHRSEKHRRAVPLGFGGDLLGLVLVERAGDRDFTGQEEDVLAELGRQMGLALHNTQLDLALQDTLDEVRRQAGEIQASRRRLVQAADGERRRIERDLHDGAQQHLVALSVSLRLARDMVGDAPEAAVELLDELHLLVKETVQEVRNLAHGIYPPLLAESGLPAALRTAAARSPLNVTVDAEMADRFTPEVEAAVYFCCLEALQNAAKHALGSSVAIRLWRDAGGLLFEVADDGPGFDVDAVSGGHGFVNMADRLGAIGGTVRWESTPGRGTRVSGALPISVVRQ